MNLFLLSLVVVVSVLTGCQDKATAGLSVDWCDYLEAYNDDCVLEESKNMAACKKHAEQTSVRFTAGIPKQCRSLETAKPKDE